MLSFVMLRVLCIVMLSVLFCIVMLSVPFVIVILRVLFCIVMLSVLFGIVMPSVIFLNTILIVIKHSFVILSVAQLSVTFLYRYAECCNADFFIKAVE
jgi:hypothetical protein